jgi:plastocyanin
LWLWVGLALLAGACAAGGTVSGDHLVVEMFDNRFSAAAIRIPLGGSVTFRGAGRNPHNAVASDGSWSTEKVFGSLTQLEDDEATLTFEKLGEYTFFCTFHGTADGAGMAARIVVGDTGASLAAQGATDTAAPSRWSGQTQRVPADYPTIQGAVDAAGPGDLVLIDPGVYREKVTVQTPGLVLRGTDRNKVIIDGEFVRENAIEVFTDGVAVENLTVRNAILNGVYWYGVRGYRASYVTAVDNGDYGIYAFDSSDGTFEHSYASGSPDSGFYVGQCDPCQAVISDVIAEWNGLGYSGTNASGDLYIVNSVWRYNAAGIVPNTLDSELLPPFHDVTIAANLVHDNDNREAPANDAQWSALGNGIILAGGNHSLVEKNRIFNHAVSGIAITPNLDRNFWMSAANIVRGNVVEASGRADLALAGPAGTGNCFEANTFSSSLPVGLEVFQPCRGWRLPMLFELGGSTEQLGRVADNGLGIRPVNLVGSAPKPGPQPGMPGGAEAPVEPAVSVFASRRPDLTTLTVPPQPAGSSPARTKGLTMFGILLASATSVFFGLYAYFLPFVLYAAWVAIALWDLARRGTTPSAPSDLGRGATIAWIAIILIVPFVGVIAYYLVGRSAIPGWQRLAFVGGGLLAYLVVLVLGALLGGVV